MSDQSLTATSFMQADNSFSMSTNKRKREGVDQNENARLTRSRETNGDAHISGKDSPELSQIHQQLLQGITQQNGVQDDDNTRTAQAALATPMQQSSYPPPDSFDSASSVAHGLPFDDPTQHSPSTMYGIGSTAHALHQARESTAMNSNKPAVGTPEWHKLRKDNHKEVERRRRETINEGINEIAKIVPNCEKNKGSILQRAVTYITELVEAQKASQSKWDFERMALDQAVRELDGRFAKMKESAQQAWAESNKWQKRCRDAGLQFDDYTDMADLDEEDGGGMPGGD